MRIHLKNALLLIAAGAMSTGAMAHTGHGTASFMEGLAHPMGADHLLAMVAVGVWSVAALPARKAWHGPATFLLTLAFSALLGASGLTLPYLDHAIALSVVLFGAMLIVATRPVPHGVGLGLIATAAALHGLAHGAETPATGFAGYAAGFMLTTTVLHLGGAAMGLSIRRWLATRSHIVLGSLGAALGGAGVYLLAHV